MVVGVVGFKNSDVTNPVTTMTIGDSDIYGVVGENKIVYVNIEPEGASNAYDFLQPTFDDEFLTFNGRNNFHFSTTLIKATSNAAGTPFQINHSAADSVTAYIHIEDFELSYELLHWEVGDALEIIDWDLIQMGIIQLKLMQGLLVIVYLKLLIQKEQVIELEYPLLQANIIQEILFYIQIIILTWNLQQRRILSLPLEVEKVYFSPVSDLVTFEPLMLEVYQDSSPTVQLTFELGYTIPIDELRYIN